MKIADLFLMTVNALTFRLSFFKDQAALSLLLFAHMMIMKAKGINLAIQW